jgi:VWFA-related protein
MRVSLPLTLLSILFSCLPLVAQEAGAVRVGVAVMGGLANTVSGAEGRDRLVKSLYRGKPNTKLPLNLEAVALVATSARGAIAEARDKNCEFLLYTRLADLTTTYTPSTLNSDFLPVFHATVEYQLNRVVDDSRFASGSIKADDETSGKGAIWQALSNVAKSAALEIKKGRGTPNPPAVAGVPATLSISAATPMLNAREYCTWLPSDVAHGDALRAVCEYAISLPVKMPNFVCGETTARYRGFRSAPVDLISASVRYEDGHESYSNVKINGRPLSDEVLQDPGLRSSGEFAGNLRAVFNLSNHALFKYSSEGKMGDRAAWIFTYKIADQKEPLWLLHAPDQIIAPPYSGELWIDEKSGAVMRFSSTAKGLPPAFPMKNVDLEIDYEKVEFGDGTNFVLPVDSTLTNIYTGEETSKNVEKFRDCHKFRAKARIVADVDTAAPGTEPNKVAPPTPGTDPTAQVPPSRAAVQKDLAEDEAIYAAIGEQALQENEIRLKGEQQRMMDAATVSVLTKLSALRSEQRKILAQLQAAETTTTTPASDLEALTTLRVAVNLVPVSVVLRDAQGRAVGTLGKENFRLFDEGKPQVISRFSVESSTPAIAAGAADASTPVHPDGPTQPQPVTNQNRQAAQERDTAYLFDDVHSSLAELASARDAAARHLGSLPAGEQAAVFSISGTVGVDFTDDREKLLAGVRNLKPHPTIPADDCPPISLYMADLMLNQHDADAGSIAVQEVEDCNLRSLGFSSPQAGRIAAAKAIQVLSAGNAESKNALVVLDGVIRRTASMPGQRTIVLVSPGFLALTPETHEVVMKIIDGAVRSGIIINTLDAEGLVAAGFTGSATDLEGSQFHSAEAEARRGVMLDFATGTGGIFFHNNNNLDEGFRRTADVPEFVYVLGFSPQRLDGKFHKLNVTLNNAPKFDLQTRRGYYALKPIRAD